MVINIINKCSKDVILQTNYGETYLIHSLECKSIASEKTDLLKVSVKKNESSYTEKMLSTRYIVTLKTTYNLFTKDKDNVNLILANESDYVIGNVYYDKVILSADNIVFNELNNSVCDVEHIKSVYNKRYCLYNLFVSPLIHSTKLCLLLFVFSTVLAVKVDLLFSIFFFIISYLFIGLINTVIANLSDRFYKVAIGIDGEKKEFHNVLTDEYATKFYQDEKSKSYRQI